MKKILYVILPLFMVTALLYAADTYKLNRLTDGIQVTGGTSRTNGKTLVTSNDSTNEYRMVSTLMTMVGGQTSYTNSTTWLETPSVIVNSIAPGVGFQTAITPNVIISKTSVIVSGLNTTTRQNVPVLIYGIVRSGVWGD